MSPEAFSPGMYKLRFETRSYWESLGQAAFYPYVEVSFRTPLTHSRFYSIVVTCLQSNKTLIILLYVVLTLKVIRLEYFNSGSVLDFFSAPPFVRDHPSQICDFSAATEMILTVLVYAGCFFRTLF